MAFRFWLICALLQYFFAPVEEDLGRFSDKSADKLITNSLATVYFRIISSLMGRKETSLQILVCIQLKAWKTMYLSFVGVKYSCF
jgi:hypothetical protein